MGFGVGVLLMPTSFLPWCLVRHKRVSVEFSNVAISTNRINPTLKNKVAPEINEILDSAGPKIEFYDKKPDIQIDSNKNSARGDGSRVVSQDD